MANTNSSPVLPQGGLGRRPGAVASRRQESDDGLWLDLSHDGYRPVFETVHHRRLYLAAPGDDLRGEDRLEGPVQADRDFAVRFHLHPEVEVTVIGDGESVLLRLPSEGRWHLRARGGALTLEDSIYLGDQNRPRRCQQVVVNGRSNHGQATVKWAIRREPRADA